MTNSSSDPPRRPGEFELIASYFAPLAAGSPGAVGLTDDAAFLGLPAGQELVVTTDALIEGVHFRRADPAETVGAKALRVNLSDLAAKGAEPVGYLMVICVPAWLDESWIRQFVQGLAKDQQRFQVTLLGGDTTATPGPLVISITALGAIPAGAAIHRHGAKPGDLVFVSGTVGDAACGLSRLQAENSSGGAEDAALIDRYLLPDPRLSLGRRLRGIATAALDVSDGLLADLNHIAEASGARITVEASRLPVSAGYIRQNGNHIGALAHAATAGDDYEIAFTVPPEGRDTIARIAAETGIAISEIGRVETGVGVLLTDAKGQPVAVERLGYVHF
jgi:thiamine-monophosphate kinase